MFGITKNRIKKEIREWAEAIIIALILTMIIRTFVVQAFKIPSSSMYPTLKIGDKIFVNKFIYRFQDPELWDIVVFKYPGNPEDDIAFGKESKNKSRVKIVQLGFKYLKNFLELKKRIKNV